MSRHAKQPNRGNLGILRLAPRPEVQALRAIAVTVVVVCHFVAGVLPGGFVGVDVFFVISGFLITALLLRELERHGVDLAAAFYARRAGASCPRALLVLRRARVLAAIGSCVPNARQHS